jgi:hypothetical protein
MNSASEWSEHARRNLHDPVGPAFHGRKRGHRWTRARAALAEGAPPGRQRRCATFLDRRAGGSVPEHAANPLPSVSDASFAAARKARLHTPLPRFARSFIAVLARAMCSDANMNTSGAKEQLPGLVAARIDFRRVRTARTSAHGDAADWPPRPRRRARIGLPAGAALGRGGLHDLGLVLVLFVAEVVLGPVEIVFGFVVLERLLDHSTLHKSGHCCLLSSRR